MSTYSLIIFACIFLAVFSPMFMICLIFHRAHRTSRGDAPIEAYASPSSTRRTAASIMYDETLPEAILAKEEFDELIERIQAKLKEAQQRR